MTLTASQIEKILKNPEETASIANLIYVSDADLNIRRKKNKEKYDYVFNNKPLKDKKELDRINKLVIPPNWEKVRIAYPPNGHLQVVGRDAKNRKVYRYHDLWSKIRNQTKFYKLASFGKALPLIRDRVDQDLDLPGMTQRKVLALILRLMEETHIRIGNDYYAKRNKTYGLSTLRTRHVTTSKNRIKFEFTGKKGKKHAITIRNKKLAKLVNRCEEIPGWELFQFYDSIGEKHRIDSGMVNDYIKEISGDLFSAKDFRTWGATKTFFETVYDIGYTPDEKENKSNVLRGFDAAAEALGNTRNVCRNYYVHPQVVDAYETGSIIEYFDKIDSQTSPRPFFTETEEILLQMISKFEIDFS
ncbi:DNA topoisomerase IB [Dokdonia sp. Hel_I_53]|uniref:DNA topoisomerase IB n=1 Tax=Dokdonia sp. Hel_I_53 TaxID=1566287 RepID=UPI00119A814B|nr:DNA topoisomerase IB [Dokdonia sp. Hel_I_53]TVZ53335.1 DNA topoisomerase-1 [Dokdonia sp. Hel_I_53]